jgi:hypothetical protein
MWAKVHTEIFMEYDSAGITGVSIWRDYDYGSRFIYKSLIGTKKSSINRLARILSNCEVRFTPYTCRLYFEAKPNETSIELNRLGIENAA